MGLTASSVGKNAIDAGLTIHKLSPGDPVIALAGNPNVGKSTVFNALTGMHQHTGNWSGKTVSNACGICRTDAGSCVLIDIPGAYSLLAVSEEEMVARNYICFGDTDAVIVVCDATCLERNLNLVLQILEITSHVSVCVNLMDEAKRKHISVNLSILEEMLGVPVIGTSARNGKGLKELIQRTLSSARNTDFTYTVRYNDTIETAINLIEMPLSNLLNNKLNPRWTAIKLLEQDKKLISAIETYTGLSFDNTSPIFPTIVKGQKILEDAGYSASVFRDALVSAIYKSAENIAKKSVTKVSAINSRQLKFDKILTRKSTGIPVMLVLLAIVFYITIVGANVPSEWLSTAFSKLQIILSNLLISANAPTWLYGALIDGIYTVFTWVISVMLPPMAIFFPLFTLLEDLGYLPRVAFNLDNSFRRCSACGKQALSMCMGFGCNAAGVTGCRIIDSPRERLIAIITNNFVPCNGRFPALIAIISMFFVGGVLRSSMDILPALILTLVIVFGIFTTLAVSYLLSKTILKGIPSSLTLEMPPFRKPQIGKVIVRSIFDRTLFVLGRAVISAAPAGLLIWLLANLTIGGETILSICTGFLNPFASLFGMDGVILMAFILGLPANEIVIPIIIMAYTASGTLVEYENLFSLHSILIANGWTWLTAVCTILFSLMHWPCCTTILTIKKETGSLKWTAISILVPTVCGLLICFFITTTAKIFGLIP